MSLDLRKIIRIQLALTLEKRKLALVNATSVGASARIALKTTQFDKVCSLVGLKTVDSRATRLGVDPATVSRVTRGLAAPGERFIAGCLKAFPELDFEDLFVVTTDAADELAAS